MKHLMQVEGRLQMMLLGLRKMIKCYERNNFCVKPGNVCSESQNSMCFQWSHADFIVKWCEILCVVASYKCPHWTWEKQQKDFQGAALNYFSTCRQVLSVYGKKFFVKSPDRREFLNNKTPDTPYPPTPVITLWHTWLDAIVYYAENFKTFVLW
jgi:hypothetical protein